jgi:hypothetical protein
MLHYRVGRLLALSTNIRLGWQYLPGKKHSSLLRKSVNYGQKKSYNIGPCPVHIPDTCPDVPGSGKGDYSSGAGFQPQHAAAIGGLFLLIFGISTGLTLLYGYLRPESRPGRILNRLRIAPYSRFWERPSISEAQAPASQRRDSQVPML